MDRVNVGKTIMSQHELDSIKMNPASSKEQINLLCDFALAMREGQISYGNQGSGYESQ